MNKYEINVFSMKRSGTHAVINWIASLFDEPVYYFDNCKIGQDPVSTKHPRGDRRGTEIDGLYVPLPRGISPEKEEIRFKDKTCVIVGYENVQVHDPDNEQFIGPSKKKYNVVLVREFRNWAASLMVGRGYNPLSDWIDDFNPQDRDQWLEDARQIWASGYNKFHRRVDMWMNHAIQYQWAEPGVSLLIPFDFWVTNRSMRKLIARWLDRENTDVALKYVGAVANEGSSFDRMQYDGQAHKMDVSGRYHKFDGNRIFQEAIEKYPAALLMSDYIFGRKA